MTGEYFSWLSHDDLYYPNKLKDQIDYLNKNPDVMIIGSGLDVIDASGMIKTSYRIEKPRLIVNGKQLMDHWVYGCSLLIRREIFDATGFFNEKNLTVQDLDMWLRIVNAGYHITLMPRILCQYRQHASSDSFKRRNLHVTEVGDFLENLLNIYQFEFFTDVNISMTKKEKQKIFVWFAQQAHRRGAPNSAKKFYRLGLSEHINIFDFTFWKILKNYIFTVATD